MMITRQEALALKTEQEWRDNADKVKAMDYDILESWSQRATDPGIKEYLHHKSVSAYHREEGYDI